MKSLEVVQLKLSPKGGLNIVYFENVSMKVEKHTVAFPHRPKLALINAIRKLAIHIPFLCEFEIGKDFEECELVPDERGVLPQEFETFSATGFSIRVKEDTEVKLFGHKKLEFAEKYMDISTPYFIVSDSKEYEYNESLNEIIVEIQVLASNYINGDYDKTGTNYNLFDSEEDTVIIKRETIVVDEDKLLSGSEVLQLEQPSVHILEEHQELNDEENQDIVDNEPIFPDGLEMEFKEEQSEIQEEKQSKKKSSPKKSSNLKPKTKPKK